MEELRKFGTRVALKVICAENEFIVKNLISDVYSRFTLRSLRPLLCLILFTAEGAKDAKISSKH